MEWDPIVTGQRLYPLAMHDRHYGEDDCGDECVRHLSPFDIRSDFNVIASLRQPMCYGISMAYKGRIGTKGTERHYPHIVELMVPLSGFGTKLNLMHDWHSFRGLESKRGSGRYRDGRHFVRWCFADPEDAKAFQKEFGGEIVRAST